MDRKARLRQETKSWLAESASYFNVHHCTKCKSGGWIVCVLSHIPQPASGRP